MPKSKSFLSLFTQLLFFKERKELLAFASLQKSDHERFAPVAHDKRATGVICSFSRAKHSFAQKNERFAQKKQWANSQSCIRLICQFLICTYSIYNYVSNLSMSGVSWSSSLLSSSSSSWNSSLFWLNCLETGIIPAIECTFRHLDLSLNINFLYEHIISLLMCIHSCIAGLDVLLTDKIGNKQFEIPPSHLLHPRVVWKAWSFNTWKAAVHGPCGVEGTEV